MPTMPPCMEHGRPLDQCGTCLPEKLWPKGRKPCRCGRLIAKKAATCVQCASFVETEADFAHRKARWAVIRQVNA